MCWHGSGWIRCYNGDHDLAIDHIGHAERLSPLDPQASQFHPVMTRSGHRKLLDHLIGARED
jgi:hypothetical protein